MITVKRIIRSCTNERKIASQTNISFNGFHIFDAANDIFATFSYSLFVRCHCVPVTAVRVTFKKILSNISVAVAKHFCYS